MRPARLHVHAAILTAVLSLATVPAFSPLAAQTSMASDKRLTGNGAARQDSTDRSRGGTRGASPSNDGQNRRIRVHNQTGWTITALYAADAGRTDWRGDLMNPAALSTGDSTVIDVDNGTGACVYVIRAEFSNGERLERVGVNVCRIGDYYFTR